MRKELSRKDLELVRESETSFRTAIVGQDTMISNLLADLLMRDLNCQAVGIGASDLLPMLDRSVIDIVIISTDINSRCGAGYPIAQSISNMHPTLPIVMIIEEASREATISALRAGARGLFNRQQPLEQLTACVRHVRNGSLWVGPEETTFLLRALREIPSLGELSDFESCSLTTREIQVVRAAGSGKTNKAIARELRLSEHTVKNYLFRAFEKLGVSSRIELLFYLTTRGRSVEQDREVVLDSNRTELYSNRQRSNRLPPRAAIPDEHDRDRGFGEN
jgi:two-component system, NarL family, nitrate/nitrite response regulator NarL